MNGSPPAHAGVLTRLAAGSALALPSMLAGTAVWTSVLWIGVEVASAKVAGFPFVSRETCLQVAFASQVGRLARDGMSRGRQS